MVPLLVGGSNHKKHGAVNMHHRCIQASGEIRKRGFGYLLLQGSTGRSYKALAIAGPVKAEFVLETSSKRQAASIELSTALLTTTILNLTYVG